jgi:hypothetical protein
MKRTVLSVCTLFMMAPSVLKAQDSTVNATSIAPSPVGTSVTAIEENLTRKSPFALNLALEMSEKIQKDEFTPKENSLTMTFEPIYKFSEIFVGSAKIAINQDNFGQHETTMSDGTIALGIKGYDFSPEFKTVHSLGTVVPVTEKSTETDRLQGTLSTSNGIAFSGLYFNLTYKLGLVRFFHEFTQNAEGSPNLQYRISHLLDLKIPITDQFSLSTVGAYRTGWTYKGFERFGFIFDADLNYDLNKNLAIFIGTSTDGNALKSNGVDSNITVFDENTSSYRMGISYLY